MSIRTLVLSSAADLAFRVAAVKPIQRLLFNSSRLNRAEFARFRQHRELQFLSYIYSMRHRARAQILQDLWVCFELGEKRNGFFVEFGSTDGQTNSNTWLLEKEFDWRGILAEPNPYWHGKLAQNRNVEISHLCVAGRSGETVTFLSTEDSDPELSGIATFADGDHFSAQRRQGKSLTIETISLNDLLRSCNAPKTIDYISMDTEGSELDILTSFDFDAYEVKLFSIEQNGKTEESIERLMARHGYQRVFPHFSQWDGWYVHPSVTPREPPIHAPLS